jgi:Family of unknown function (DUF5317)
MSLALAVILIGLTARYGLNGLLRLGTLRLRGLGAVGIALVLQLALLRWPEHALGLTAGTALAVVYLIGANWQLAGVKLIGLGALLNLGLMLSAGGLMPITDGTLGRIGVLSPAIGTAVTGTKGIVVAEGMNLTTLLSDVLVTAGPLGGAIAWSIGDVLLLVGLGVLCWSVMRGEGYARLDRHAA